jgi:hypothetical protein
MTLEAKLLRCFGIALFPFFMAAPVLAATSSHVQLSDDAYHFSCFADGQHDANYVER